MDTAEVSIDRCLVVANPAAGTVSEELVEDVAARCARHTKVEVVLTGGRGHATAIARAESGAGDGLRVVVAVGGDGTVLEVANGLVEGGAGTALLVVPAGTGNSGYRSHWGTLPWREAIDTALGDPAASLRRLDLARLRETGELVVLGAGAGLSADVLRTAREEKRSGRAKLQAGLERAASAFVPYPGRVTVDGVVVHEGDTVMVNAGGGRYRAWQYLVLPDSELDDGLLDVCVVGAATAPAEVPDLLLRGGHIGRPGVVYLKGRVVVIERTDGRPLCFEHDGELADLGRPLVTVEVLPGALPVLCSPAATRAERAG